MQKIIGEEETTKTPTILKGVSREKKYFIECYPETKAIIDQVHIIRGGTRKDFIHKSYLVELNILMRTEAVEKRSDIGDIRLDGLIERFLKLATLDIKKYKSWTYMPFARWFVNLPEEQKDLVLENTIDMYLENWNNLLFINGSLSGNSYKKLIHYLEDRGVLEQIKDYTIIIKERKAFEEQERLEAIETRKKKRLERKRNDIIYEKVEKYKKSISKPLWDIPFSEQPKEREKINEKVRIYEEELRNEL